MLASKEIRSLFSSMIADEAEEGGVGKMCCHSVTFEAETRLVGSAEEEALLARLRVTMWMAPQRMSIWRVSRDVKARF